MPRTPSSHYKVGCWINYSELVKEMTKHSFRLTLHSNPLQGVKSLELKDQEVQMAVGCLCGFQEVIYVCIPVLCLLYSPN